MLVDVVIEQRFYCCQNGKLWTENAFPLFFWQRYLSVFSAVNIVARVQDVEEPESQWQRVDGEAVSFSPLPIYIGPWGFVKTLPRLFQSLRMRRKIPRKVIYRVPGILAALYHLAAMSKEQSYAAEVVGDPQDVFAEGASQSGLRVFFKWLFVKLLKAQCQGARAISYVTEYSLQKRYPAAPAAFSTYYSSIQLMPDDFMQRSEVALQEPLQIVCIGNLSQPYKGCDFMLQGIAELTAKGLDVNLHWVGGGSLLDEMQRLVIKLNIQHKVTFVGNLSSREQIRQELDQADLFILSSRQEGLPRVLIEAMARSLLCIATDVGGVRELLADEFVIQRDNMQQLLDTVMSISQLSPQEQLVISQQNYTKACEYKNEVLEARRQAMYQHLLDTQ